MEHRYGQALGHGSDTAGVATVFCHKYGRSPLDNFYFFDVDPRLWPHFPLEFVSFYDLFTFCHVELVKLLPVLMLQRCIEMRRFYIFINI